MAGAIPAGVVGKAAAGRRAPGFAHLVPIRERGEQEVSLTLAEWMEQEYGPGRPGGVAPVRQDG